MSESKGCCSGCNGTGYDGTPETNGACTDCRATGCAHPEPLCATEPERGATANEWEAYERRREEEAVRMVTQLLAPKDEAEAKRRRRDRAYADSEVLRSIVARHHETLVEGLTEDDLRTLTQLAFRLVVEQCTCEPGSASEAPDCPNHSIAGVMARTSPRRNGKTLLAAQKWAMVKFTVAVAQREAEDRANASEANGWLMRSQHDLYEDVIDTVSRLATGSLDAQGYLEEERRKALEGES